MNIQDIQLMYDYNYWANKRILNAAANVSQEQFITPTSHSFSSLRGTLVHTIDAEMAWRNLFQFNTFMPDLSESAFPTMASLQAKFDEEEKLMRAYLNTMNDGDMINILRYPIPETGNMRERVLWHCLVHVVNHGTQHRSESAAILTDYRQSPGDLDFTVFLNDWA
jgi:uncharacterized damage-inducible protein DinB